MKNNKGSITLFTLISFMFFIIVLLGTYIFITNKNQAQSKEISEIEEKYRVKLEALDEMYENILIGNDGYLTVYQDTVVTGVDKVELVLVANTNRVKKIILPSGEEIENEGTFTVSENGEYVFQLVMDDGTTMEKICNVSNIKEGIDITNIIPGGDAHQHIYQDRYDSTYHWKECNICGALQSAKVAHTLQDSWATDLAHCHSGNMCTTYCTLCGYSTRWREQHKIGTSYVWTDQGWQHHSSCTVCRTMVTDLEIVQNQMVQELLVII